MSKVLHIGVNAPRDLAGFNNSVSLDNQKILKKINNIIINKSDLNDETKYDVVVIDSSLEKKDFYSQTSNNDELIISVTNKDNNFVVNTGKYIGDLFINNVCVSINSGYAEFFEKRLLDFFNNIYFDNSTNYESSNADRLKKLIQYLFLSSLKKALVMGLPKKYVTIEECSFNIKGNIDIQKYIKNYKTSYKGIHYRYRNREYCKSIMDVLSTAINLCDPHFLSNSFKDMSMAIQEIKSYSNSKAIQYLTIKKAQKEPILNNEMYAPYRKVLAYAEMIIRHEGFSPSETKTGKHATGWLIDIADLWELYLYKLLLMRFRDWTVSYQEEIPFYKELFFGRNFVPDIVMKKGNKIVILDAKFKKMDFNEHGNDVDREDLQQIHTYYGYFKENGYDVMFTSLVYPSRQDAPNNKKSIGAVFSSDKSSLFGVSYLKIGNNPVEQAQNESAFLNRISDIINRQQ